MTDNDSKDIQLIALDMDGTLLDEEKDVSEENRNAIDEARKRGVEVILCTGRHFMTASEYTKSLGLSSYFVTVNGSEIWTADGEIVERQLLDTAIVQSLIELQKKHNTFMWMSSTKDVFRGTIPDNVSDYEWLKIGFDTEDEKIKQKIIDELVSNPEIELSNSSLTNIEINAVGINKAKAIEKVCQRLGIKMEQVMAVGDSLNDIRMIQEAGLGVAMGNAQQQVKDAADWVTSSNDENGVARAIQRWVLHK